MAYQPPGKRFVLEAPGERADLAPPVSSWRSEVYGLCLGRTTSTAWVSYHCLDDPVCRSYRTGRV